MTEREREKISATPWQKLLVDFLFAGSETKTQIIRRFFFNSNSRPICLLALMCNPVKYLTSQHNTLLKPNDQIIISLMSKTKTLSDYQQLFVVIWK